MPVAPAAADAGARIAVQVCYASDSVQFLRDLDVAAGTTIAEAIVLSGVQAAVPDIDVQTLAVGIYAKKKTPDTVLRAHDRIELYRPLIADPKQARRRKPANR